MYSGSYQGSQFRTQVPAECVPALMESTHYRAGELPVKRPSIDVFLSLVLKDILADESKATWKPQAGSDYNNALLDVDENGVACGDLRRALLHRMTTNQQGTDFLTPINYTITEIEGVHTTSTGTGISGTILPNLPNKEHEVFVRPPTIVTEALIGIMNLSQQGVRDSFTTYLNKMTGEMEHWVQRGTSAALSATDPKHVLKARAKQLQAHVQEGKPISTFVEQPPFIFHPDQPYIKLAPAYWQSVMDKTLKRVARSAKESSQFFTNLAGVNVVFTPPKGSWSELATALTQGKSVAVAKEILSTPFYVSMKMCPSYTICSGKVWEKTTASIRKAQIEQGHISPSAAITPVPIPANGQ